MRRRTVYFWILALAAAVAVALLILLPPAERVMAEAYTVAGTHWPAEAGRHQRYVAKAESCAPYLERMETGEHEMIFLSMYSLESFAEEDFLFYRGISIVKMEPVLDNSLELLSVLELLLSGGTLPERVCLGIDPVKLGSHFSWEEEPDWRQAVAALIERHEEIQWEVLLSYPSLTEWQQMTDDERERGITAYGQAMRSLSALDNVTLFYIGGLEWLICNQDNYAGESVLNASVTKTMMLRMFCDGNHVVTQDMCAEALEELRRTLDTWGSEPACAQTSSDDTLVFLGDSVFGNYTDSASIPGVVENFTGAKCINCGYGGITLTKVGNMSGVDVVENLCNGQTGDIAETVTAYSGIREFVREGTGDGRLIFLLNYGINDYMVGHPIAAEDRYAADTYAGALRTVIERLQSSYPEAEILIVTPGYITFYDCGTYLAGETSRPLREYADEAVRVAQEYGLPYMDIYDALERYAREEEVLLADGVHPSERGRFLLGRLICEKIGEL
ncbi:MAG: SGNH/GDSL hydrolase family protein [bacterium]|nr:SGNH/GDSL hydrolase family protein [bacterium]MCM1374903.1 SGNH/GDSL hydrolase family protein [Muribaculum sp.]